MPLIYQHQINGSTKLGVWHITEPENFFIDAVPLQRSITHPHKRLQHFAGRFLLLQLEPDFPFDLIKIADTRKPFLENEAFHFSISHCDDFAAVIISNEQRVGIDIEMVDEKIERIIHKFLTADENHLLTQGKTAEAGTLCWSIKESIFKWYGKGEVDFRKHIRIHSLDDSAIPGIARCSFLKQDAVKLIAQFIFLENKYLSWIISSK